MPRFVLMQHDHPFLHWDLMLEADDVLRTWRLLEAPEPGKSIRAEPLGDHRKFYLNYEGPLSGNRGTVTRCDSGTFVWEEENDERVIVQLEGQRARGRALLQKGDFGAWSFRLEGVP